jgi:lysophospholipase L1-like esterase
VSIRFSARLALARAGLVVVGLIFALVLLEASMQAVAAIRSYASRGDQGVVSMGDRIVCLGDSNTFGLYVGKENAFPRVLEKLWNDDPSRPRVDIVNLGYPGNNSSVLRNRFVEVLSRFHPSTVMILIGANDFWTVPEPISGDPPLSRLRVQLWHYSRVYRLFHMLRQAWVGPELDRLPNTESESRWAPQNGGVAEWQKLLRQNVLAMVATAREAGVRPILLTYASSDYVYGGVNQEIRAIASEAGVPLIDVAPAFAQGCRGQAECDLFFKDQHPTQPGHLLMGRTILAQLLAMSARGVDR